MTEKISFHVMGIDPGEVTIVRQVHGQNWKDSEMETLRVKRGDTLIIELQPILVDVKFHHIVKRVWSPEDD